MKLKIKRHSFMSGLNKKILLVLLFLFLLGMGFVSYGSLFGYVPETGIGREALAAALGALFVVLATGVQLHQQTDMEVERHKKQKTYENRLGCYTELLKTKAKFSDKIITDEKVEIVASQKLQAHLVCEQEDTFRALEDFLGHIVNLNELHGTLDNKKLNALEMGSLTQAYEHLASMLMLDLKDGFNNLKPAERTLVTDAINYLSSTKSAGAILNPTSVNKYPHTPKRNTSKIEFNGIEYTKKLYVYKVMKSYVDEKGLTFSDLQKKYTDEKLSEIKGLNLKDARQHFHGATTFWLEEDQAQAKKKKSTEGDSWDRYWIDDDMLLQFSDGKKIALRNGQDTKSVEVFQKWCQHNKIPLI
jgi:hypothetical protein